MASDLFGRSRTAFRTDGRGGTIVLRGRCTRRQSSVQAGLIANLLQRRITAASVSWCWLRVRPYSDATDLQLDAAVANPGDSSRFAVAAAGDCYRLHEHRCELRRNWVGERAVLLARLSRRQVKSCVLPGHSNQLLADRRGGTLRHKLDLGLRAPIPAPTSHGEKPRSAAPPAPPAL